MIDRIPKSVVVAVVGCGGAGACAISRIRGRAISPTRAISDGLLLLELVMAAVWMYRRVFFPLIVVSFLLAGVESARFGSVWTSARWLVLGVGAPGRLGYVA